MALRGQKSAAERCLLVHGAELSTLGLPALAQSEQEHGPGGNRRRPEADHQAAKSSSGCPHHVSGVLGMHSALRSRRSRRSLHLRRIGSSDRFYPLQLVFKNSRSHSYYLLIFSQTTYSKSNQIRQLQRRS